MVKNLKNIPMWVFLLIGVLVIFGLVFFSLGSMKVKDCGQDIDCFIQAAETCSPAKMIYSSSVLPGFGLTTKAYYEVRKSGSRCGYYSIIQENQIKYPQELIQSRLESGETLEDINAAEQEAQKQAKSLEGKDGECIFSDGNKLKKFFEDFKAGSFGFSCTFDMETQTSKCTGIDPDTNLPIEYSCSGSLYEQS